MTTDDIEPVILPRSFVGRIAESLAKITDERIAIRSEWRFPIEADHVPYTLNVPIDAELIVPLIPRRGDFEALEPEAIEREALAFATALVTLKKGTKFLQAYARKMRSEALVQVEKIRARGIDMRFHGISFKQTSADALTSSDRTSALASVIAEVRISVCDHTGRREQQVICIEEPDQIASEILHHADRQREWQDARDLLDQQDADLRIGRVCLDVLESTGAATADVMKTIGQGKRWYHTGDDGAQCFAGESNGTVEASIELSNAYWDGSTLSLRDPKTVPFPGYTPKGSDPFSHTAFAECLQENGLAEGHSGANLRIDNPADWLVNLETGRIWQENSHAHAVGEHGLEQSERVLN